MKRTDLDRIEIHWVDSTVLSGWRSTREIRQELLDGDALTHITVGLLYQQTDTLVIVALSASANNHDGELGDVIAIPTAAIKDMIPLTRKGGPKHAKGKSRTQAQAQPTVDRERRP